MVRPVLENSIIFFLNKGFPQLLVVIFLIPQIFNMHRCMRVFILGCVFYGDKCLLLYPLRIFKQISVFSGLWASFSQNIYKDDPVPALAETEADLEDHLPAEGRRHRHHLHLPLHHPDSPHHLPNGPLHAHRWAGHLWFMSPELASDMASGLYYDQ